MKALISIPCGMRTPSAILSPTTTLTPFAAAASMRRPVTMPSKTTALTFSAALSFSTSSATGNLGDSASSLPMRVASSVPLKPSMSPAYCLARLGGRGC